MTESKPRILLIKTRTYVPVPDRFTCPDDNKELYKSFQRFPIKNPHWRCEVIEHDGKEYLLESINETALDTKERSIHEFVEDEEGIHETSIVYFEGKDGQTIAVRANNEGYVYVGECSDDVENIDPSNMIFISNGRRNDLGFPYEKEIELEEEQWDDDFDDYNSKREDFGKDPYGNPLKSITLENGEIIHFRTYEYIYATA